MWDINSTTQLLKAISASAGPDHLLRVFMEHVRRDIQVRRAAILSTRGLAPGQYRILRSVDVEGIATPAGDRGEVRAGGLLSRLLASGRFQSIAKLSPDAQDPAYDLLCGSRSLMAFPLFENGAGTGMVVLLGSSPHACGTRDLCGLAIVSALLDRAACTQALAQQLDATCRALDAELQSAADVQRWLLPPMTSRIGGADLAASYQTARRSGGDYYDVGELPDGRVGVLIADVSGKGAAAAVLMAVLRTIVHDELDRSRRSDPAALLDYVDARLCALGLPGRGVFVTAFSGALDMHTGAFTYSCAGHPPPRVLRSRRRIVTPLDGAGAMPLGVVDERCAHTEETVTLMPGDLALFYTDGITEARSPEGDFFGASRLDEILLGLPEPASAASAVAAIDAAVRRFTGAGPLSDDQTLLCLRLQQP